MVFIMECKNNTVELVRVLNDLMSLMETSTDSLIHSLIIARTVTKVISFIVFSPFWKLFHSPIAVEEQSHYFVSYGNLILILVIITL